MDSRAMQYGAGLKFIKPCQFNRVTKRYMACSPLAVKNAESTQNTQNTATIKNKNSTKFVTIVVPTIGRKSLPNTIQSVLNQTSNEWKLFLSFDGVNPSDEILNLIKDDRRIQFKVFPKVGFKNCAGEVRNQAIKLIDTEWVGFVDDDDILSPSYVEDLKNEIIRTPTADCIVFRMVSHRRIIPNPKAEAIVLGDVGISFACKKKIFDDGIYFKPSRTEDYNLLNRIKNNSYQIVFSNHINYFVRSSVISGKTLFFYKCESLKIAPMIIK